MAGDWGVLVVGSGGTDVRDRLSGAGVDATVAGDLEDALAGGEDADCVVCGEVEGHTTAELVGLLDEQVGPVVFAYGDDEEAAAALDAGAAATIPRDAGGEDWGVHLAATLRSVRREEGERPERDLLVSNALDELPDIFFVVGVDGQFIRWNERLVETTGYADEEIRGMRPTEFVEGEDVARIENAIGRVVMEGRATEVADIVTKDGRAIPHEFTGALIDAGGVQAIVGAARDIRERRERERELEAQAAELEAVNHVNAVIRDVVRGLLAAGTREDIEQTVCETLTGEDAYRFAWLGSYDAASEQVEPDAWAGEGEGYLEERPAGGREGEDGVTALTAMRERTVDFVQDVADAPAADAWRAQALEYGHRSGAAIPVVYDDATYGCLCLYAEQPDAFGTLEREVLAELGEIIGHAIHAAEARRALRADTVTRIQFQITDEASFLVQASQYTDADLELVGSVNQPDGAIVHLFTVSGVDPELVERFAEAAPMPAEVVTRREGESVVKVTLEGYSISHALAEVGGTVRSITVAGDEVRVLADVPRDVSVQTVLEKVRDVFEVKLLSQREVERDDRTDVDFRADVERHLTDRQLEVLETAFRAGFFEWPREQTGQEVAELLDVSPPTFHQHLRVGEEKLLRVLFDDDSSAGRGAGTTGSDVDLSDVAGGNDASRD